MSEPNRIVGAQDTGNPVLDSLVNLYAGNGFSIEGLEAIHACLLKLAALEPGGLCRNSGKHSEPAKREPSRQ